MSRRTVVLPVLLALLATALLAAQTSQAPTFRAGVDLIRLDAQVVSEDGTPVTDLTEADFNITVHGKPCPVRTLQFLDLRRSDEPVADTARYRDVSTNQKVIRGRLTIIAIDESSLPEDTRPLMDGLSRLISGFGPQDQTALIALPRPGVWHDFTHDAGELQALLKRASSRNPKDVPEAIPLGVTNVNPDTGNVTKGFGDVAVDRGEEPDYRSTPATVPSWMATTAGNGDSDLMYALEALARRLKTVDGPKTLILVSTQFPAGVGLTDYRQFAQLAAAARLSVYILKPHEFATASTAQSGLTTPFEEAGGIDFLAGLTGGVVLNAVADASGVLARIERETSGTYVIGVEPPAGIERNKPLDVTVKVRRAGLTVRTPKVVVSPAASSTKPPKDVRGAVGTTLHDPRIAVDVGLKVTTYSAMGAEPDRVKTVIVAQADEPGDANGVSWGFEVHDGDRMVADAYEKSPTRESTSGTIITSASLPPGSYTLRFVTVDGHGRRASVDHPVNVELHEAAGLQFSDVFVGQAVDGHFSPRISVGASATDLVSFVELYAADKSIFDGVSVEFSLRGADGAARVAARGRVQPALNSPKALAQVSLSLAHLTPGVYEVVATVVKARRPVGDTRREIIIGQDR